MMSPKDTSLEEEEVVNVCQVERDGVRWEGGRILLSRPKLHLTTFYDNGIYGTYVSKGVGHGRRDEKMA